MEKLEREVKWVKRQRRGEPRQIGDRGGGMVVEAAAVERSIEVRTWKSESAWRKEFVFVSEGYARELT
jgi:hypothetical protein